MSDLDFSQRRISTTPKVLHGVAKKTVTITEEQFNEALIQYLKYNKIEMKDSSNLKLTFKNDTEINEVAFTEVEINWEESC